jgi:ribosomal protein S18 acetylase RimI-like enzyme
MIQKATFTDLDQIHSLTKKCAQRLIEKGIFQWNDAYPSKEVLKNDIQLQQIWNLEEKNQIIGIIVLTEIEDIEYKKVKWLTKSCKNLYIHRLAIHPNFQGKGFAHQLMDFAENYAKINKYASVRLDTFSQNSRNITFYEARNYNRLEAIYFPKQSEFPFYCYELVLNEK